MRDSSDSRRAKDGGLFRVPDAELILERGFLDPTSGAELMRALRRELSWRADEIVIYGRRYALPRLQSWIGDAGCRYTYSGIELEPLAWSTRLLELRGRLAAEWGIDFNCVLANLYRDGADSIGWHADDEAELGPHPVIATLSLGATRRFRMRHKTRRDVEPVSIELASGDLLVMRGATQEHWEHQVPKTKRAVGERINLSFRRIASAPAGR